MYKILRGFMTLWPALYAECDSIIIVSRRVMDFRACETVFNKTIVAGVR